MGFKRVQKMLPVLFTIVAVLILVDIYAYQAVKTTWADIVWVKRGYWIITIASILYIIYSVVGFDRAAGSHKVINNFMGLLILIYVPKLFVVLMLFSEDLFRYGGGVFAYLGDVLSRNGETSSTEFIASRRKFVSQLGLLIATVPLTGIVYGIVKGRYNFRVIKQTVFFDNLPEAFDGFKITQLSDIHSGSFDNPEKVAYAINLINQQDSDALVFTGDLVNNTADEMDPWMDTFKQLKTPKYGKFSVLGNHDYGDYVSWPDKKAKVDNLNKLKSIHKELGFNLLLDRRVSLEKDGEQIDVLGVENWGGGSFAKYGDLEKALDNSPKERFKVLLSHDPSHYDEQVKNHENQVDLTLSGHTHGMQFGIEIPGIVKISPARLRYSKWAGLYEENKRYLYVNRGFGYLAFPGRVGIWPEITVLELKKKTG